MFNANQIALTANAFMSEQGYDMERAIDEALKAHDIEEVSDEEREAVRDQLKRHQEAIKADQEAERLAEEADAEPTNVTENELEEPTVSPVDDGNGEDTGE